MSAVAAPDPEFVERDAQDVVRRIAGILQDEPPCSERLRRQREEIERLRSDLAVARRGEAILQRAVTRLEREVAEYRAVCEAIVERVSNL